MSNLDRQRFKPGIPVLIAEAMTDGVHLRAWCPWCRQFHYHGAAGGEGHCVAHRVGGPFQQTGYYIIFASTAVRMDRRRR